MPLNVQEELENLILVAHGHSVVNTTSVLSVEESFLFMTKEQTSVPKTNSVKWSVWNWMYLSQFTSCTVASQSWLKIKLSLE